MKKIFLIAGVTFMLSCNDDKKDSTTTTTEKNQTTTKTYTASEGDVTYRGGKVLVYRNNSWVDTDDDVRFDNGIVVRRNGRVVRDNDAYELEEGVVVTRTGDFFDKAGNVIQDGWEGIKKGFRNVKEEVKDAVTPDKNKTPN